MTSDSLNEIYVELDQTVKEFLSQFTVEKTFTSRQFIRLTVKVTTARGDSFSFTNYDRITAKYSKEEYDKEKESPAPPDNLIIKAGTSVILPNGVVRRQIAQPTTVADAVNMSEFKPFIAKALKNLFENPNYIQSVKNQNGQEIATQQINDISVYIWIRSITNSGDNSQEGTWYNVSACVDYIETNVNNRVGSFVLNLQPVLGVYDKLFGWSMDNISGYQSGGINEDIIATASISKYEVSDDNFLKRNDFFFEKTLRENDLVYIRFEGLEAEKRKKLLDRSFGGHDIPGQIYDMIGLIDGIVSGSNRNNVNINVYGRDLMKLLIEDGSIFFPEQIGQQIFNNPNSLLTRRNLIEAEARFLTAASTSFKTVQSILKYIFNKFSSIGLVPSNLFNVYGIESQRKKYSLTIDNTIVNGLNDKFLQEERQGLWRIIDLVLDPNASKRVLADNSISTDNGSIINSIRKVCQEPFVEFRGDTYGDKYYFIVRKLPFDATGYRGMVYKDVETDDITDGVNILGGITKTKNNIFGSINKGIQKLRQNASRERNRNILSGRPSLISDLVIDIDESDVISDSLKYSNEAYSWYRIIPRGLGITNDTTSFALASIVSFDEYAEVFGNKAFEIEYNYCPTEFVDSSFAQKQMKYAESQAFYDMQYIIQSHAYLPFTREGVITINGDRRIKMGMMFYYKPTDEIFYVDSVRNVRTLNDRYTVLSVSRGMKEKYIKGKYELIGGKTEFVSYFDIVKTNIATQASINNSGFLKNWSVNKNLFNFFLQSRQTA